MSKGVIRLLRTPLREGETAYAMTNVDQGLFVDGAKKGEKMPRTHRHAQILPDGRLLWEFPDTEINRVTVQSMLPQIPNPPFAYSVELPEGVTAAGAAVTAPAPDPAFTPIPKAVRKPKAAKAAKVPKEKAAKAPKAAAVVQNADPQPAPPVPQGQGRKPSRSKGKTASGGK